MEIRSMFFQFPKKWEEAFWTPIEEFELKYLV